MQVFIENHYILLNSTQTISKYELTACFSPVNKSNIGEHKFDGYGSEKIGSWKMEKNRGFGNPKSS